MLWRDLKAWQIYGANTDVGKTIVSTILCKALQRRATPNSLLYLKPVSTGPQDEADDRHITRHAQGVVSKCISQFSQPVSPHIAAQAHAGSSNAISDKSIINKVKRVLSKHVESGGRFALLETAGGVLSPGPSGTVQADLYRPLRLPSLLVGDSKLGGIGVTISAFESLRLRGYDIDSVMLFDDPKWGNHAYLQEHFFKHDIETLALPLPPPRRKDPKDDEIAMVEYYNECSSNPTISKFIEQLNHKHFSRISKLTSLPSHADAVVWHPFRQHGIPHNIIAIDSAYGDHFQAYDQAADPSISSLSKPQTSSLSSIDSQSKSLLTPLFDGSASWWTQGFGHGNPDLALTAAYAAGRYGHVMFAHAVHEPALDLCYNLLSTLKSPRLSRVFFSDNGSTGMEVAVKMALRASCQRYGWNKDDSENPIGIIGLKGSYHGDTIGVMNCSEPSVFNEKVDWYKPWGFWFDPPELLMKNGKWELSTPASIHNISIAYGNPIEQHFEDLTSVFDFSSREDDERFYKNCITKILTDLTQRQGLRFGALIMEPLLMGAGGMIFVDPLFQRTLIKTIRENPSLINPDHDPTTTTDNNNDDTDWSGLPLIADEVFTGLYRLGRASSSSFLSSSSSHTHIPTDIAPDISVHAKLLTGGLLPLALTTASDSIFNTFVSESKTDALLHGHSYTAHPVGCAVANKALKEMAKLDSPKQSSNGSVIKSQGSHGWGVYKSAWSSSSTSEGSQGQEQQQGPTYSFFSPTFLNELSHSPRLRGCFALGSVLVLKMYSDELSGYSSTATASLQARLLTTLDEDGCGIHSRVLGDVIYFMTSLTTQPDQVKRLERTILKALNEETED